ncbi:MAG: Asp-tRNA(Asn)/Glu-tRNA(Gln) amidotransferase subunit GatB [Patescibacteria group bacterium]
MYIPVIGLEIHTELKTNSKMFCPCANNPDEKSPNTNICPICMGHPGTLPTINKKAVEAVLELGIAIGGTISRKSHFDRKSYFYPDLPKGYQISQYDAPFVEGGSLEDVRIKRIHLEEDVASSKHSDIKEENYTLIDFNRAGVPLMELVTEPDIKNGEQALRFGKELQRIIRCLNISDADMEKGQMRVEVNISLMKEGAKEWGTKVEIKNLNSFRAVQGSIDYEIKRQSELLDSGEKIIQETRGWNDQKCITVSQRTKESAHDYRYFPEPDLPELTFTEEYITSLEASLPELPNGKRKRFAEEFALTPHQVDDLLDDQYTAIYFEEAVSELKAKIDSANVQLLFNYLTSDLRGIAKTKGKDIREMNISPEHFAHLIFLIQNGTLSSRIAKDLLVKMADTGSDPETLIKEGGIQFMGDEGSLLPIVQEIIQKNEKAVADYKKGKENSVAFLVGQAMGKTKGQADPEKLRELFKQELGKI